MIASRNTGVERVSTLQGEKIAMSIDTSSEAMAHIMKSMIDLYKDQVGACIREYSTNAWDAHVQHGNTDTPIEVSLPGPLSPFLVVRDFGVGLSVDDIFEIYSKYGASTKRESNDVQGMLGYGCKAALSYTPQFIVTSVKDGVRAQIAVSREANGGGSMQIVDTSSTTEANGTTIQIPTRSEHVDDFVNKARLFFSFWETFTPGRVLVNGKTPEPITGLSIGDNMLVVDMGEDAYGRREAGKNYVVMGGVAYPVTFPYAELGRGYGIVVHVPIGAVNFTPSREGLMEQDPDTTATLAAVLAEFKRLAPAAIQVQIDKAATPSEALDTMVRYQGMLPGTRGETYRYRGHDLPSEISLARTGTMIATRHSSALGSCQLAWDYDSKIWGKTLWMEGYDGTKFTASHKRKIYQWCEKNGKQALTHFLLVPGVAPDAIKRYCDKSNIIQWADVKAEKLPVVQAAYGGYSGRTKAITGSFSVWVNGDWKGEVAANDIDTTNPVFFRHGNKQECRRYARVLAGIHAECTFVCVPGNRLEKFKRDFPSAQEGRTAAETAAKNWKGALTADQKAAFAMDDGGVLAFFKALDILKVDDPAIKRAIRIAKIDLTKLDEQRNLMADVDYTRHEFTFDNPLAEAYPLIKGRYVRYSAFTAFTGIEADHFYIYVNAAYAASKKGA